MDTPVLILNLSYLLVAVALLVRDMLALRTVILVSEALIIVYGYVADNTTIMAWNALFIAINGYQIARLILDRRPLQIPEGIGDIYESTFAGMSSREFLYFWNTGKKITVRDGSLCREGVPQTELLLILEGSVSIQRDHDEVARLGRGDFVAEMSFLTGEPASADAKSVGEARCIAWSQDKLHQLEGLDRDLLMKLQLVLGRDLTKKLRTEAQPARR